jgi:DNA polymerase III alpha subunit
MIRAMQLEIDLVNSKPFPDRLYVIIQNRFNAVLLSNLSHKLGLPTAITHPIYYLNPERAMLQLTLAAIRLNKPLDRLSPDESYKAEQD